VLKIISAERKTPVLASSSLNCLSHIPCINLTSGCAHECLYCYARGYSLFPGENRVIIYKNILERLKNEIGRKKIKPTVVYFSPSSDIFQPVPEVLELGHSVLEFLLSSNIRVALLTKGIIPAKTLDLLLYHTDKVKVQIGIITHNDNIRRVFEPKAAGINERLRQMKVLVDGRIAVEARIVPVIPGLTDSWDDINYLLNAFSKAGVKRAALSTLFLRPAIAASLKLHISDKDILRQILDQYKDSHRLPVQAVNSSVIPLPLPARKEIYARFRQVAQGYAIDLSICGCMNPDIGGSCNITGHWPKYSIQPKLFDQEV
jgi:DNA repair photolyase